MKLIVLFMASSMFFTGSLLAETAVDRQVENAMADITRYENQFAGQTSASPSSVNRTLKLLGLTRQRLDSSPNQSDPSWLEADARYKALVAQMISQQRVRINKLTRDMESRLESMNQAGVKPFQESRICRSIPEIAG